VHLEFSFASPSRNRGEALHFLHEMLVGPGYDGPGPVAKKVATLLGL
jgi:hypothetical protein